MRGSSAQKKTQKTQKNSEGVAPQLYPEEAAGSCTRTTVPHDGGTAGAAARAAGLGGSVHTGPPLLPCGGAGVAPVDARGDGGQPRLRRATAARPRAVRGRDHRSEQPWMECRRRDCDCCTRPGGGASSVCGRVPSAHSGPSLPPGRYEWQAVRSYGSQYRHRPRDDSGAGANGCHGGDGVPVGIEGAGRCGRHQVQHRLWG
jgi:hypothetical protein